MRPIQTALISVFNKDGLLPLLEELKRLNIKILSTGGTHDFIQENGFAVHKVEDVTGYPSIFGGRVKTLHPKVFGGILFRRNDKNDVEEQKKFDIDSIDLVVVDLYPFTETVKKGGTEEEIIEKIDIGGISLIRAAAKNFEDVLIIPSKAQYGFLLEILRKKDGITNISDRKKMAMEAFRVSSGYDQAIAEYFSGNRTGNLKELRYGENPHQKASFSGSLNDFFDQLHGKELSFNNLLDVDSGLRLINDLPENSVAIIKHLNPCGVATCNNLLDSWNSALSADPVSAFGGIFIIKGNVSEELAIEIDKIFFEIIVAPDYTGKALEILQSKKNRIILKLKNPQFLPQEHRSILNGELIQDRDTKIESMEDLKFVTGVRPSQSEIEDLLFANVLVKHVKSNAIVIVKNKQLIGVGMGQTSRIDAIKQAIEKARKFGFDLNGASLASDAFFPFHDSVKEAFEVGIKLIIQPGGSVRDQESVDFCNANGIAMVFTGYRHFKH